MEFACREVAPSDPEELLMVGIQCERLKAKSR
jgi:hypothetical protein